MPPLRTTAGVANTLKEKEEALRNRFFLEPEADLGDITNTSFEDTIDQLDSDCQAIEGEIQHAISSQKSKGAPGPDGISPRFLKAMGKPLATALASLTTAC
jgi:hypothetical protein